MLKYIFLHFTEQPPSPPTEELETQMPFTNNFTQLRQNVETQTFSHNENEQSNIKYKIQSDTYKCTECSKCFKDPDVFVLHKRTHTKIEKENGNTDEMLRANPILANLLQSNSQVKNETTDVKNINSIENQIMAALTANMENYLRNLSTIMTNGSTEFQDGGQDGVLNCDSQDFEADTKLVIDESV